MGFSTGSGRCRKEGAAEPVERSRFARRSPAQPLGDTMTAPESSFATEGFFSRQAEKLEAEQVAAQSRFFTLFKDALQVAHEYFVQFKIPKGGRFEVYAACLFVRVLEVCQGVVLLAARGLQHDAEILLRTSIEALLRLRAACTEPDLFDRVLATDIRNRITFLETTLHRNKGHLTEDAKADMESRRRELKDLFEGTRPQRISTEELAEKLGQSDLYQALFRFSSQHSHLSVFAIEEYLEVDHSGLPKSLRYEPRHSQLGLHVAAATEVLLDALSMIFEKQKIEIPVRVGELRESLAELDPSWPEIKTQLDEILTNGQ